MDSQMATQTSYNKTIVRKIYYKFARFLEVMAVKLSDKVFTVSKFMEQDYKKYNDQVYHLPNGADVEIIDKIKPKRTFDKFTITYLGGFEAWRGLDLLIDAFKNVNARLNAKLLLIGGGPDFERIKAYAGNDKNITLTGYMDHDAALARCKGSDVLVMPSRNTLASQSISSIKCFEYIVCGVPTLVTNSGEHAYWLRKFGAGLVVPDNTEGFAQGLLKLKKNKKLYARLRQNALKNKANVDYKRFKKIFAEEVLK
jgi:glycosyltransferase involved in cell wall biosynthesis